MRRFFSWLQSEGDVDGNPMQRLKAARVPEEPLAPASVHQVRAMLSLCNRKSETGVGTIA
jgi:site-specific recombinase XerD